MATAALKQTSDESKPADKLAVEESLTFPGQEIRVKACTQLVNSMLTNGIKLINEDHTGCMLPRLSK